VRHPIILLPLHAPVLKPDFDLSLGETELVGHLDASPARQVAVEVKLFLKFQCLVTSVRRACSLAVTAIHAINAFAENQQQTLQSSDSSLYGTIQSNNQV